MRPSIRKLSEAYTTANKYLVAMADDGILYVYCGGTTFRQLFPTESCEQIMCCPCEAVKHPRPAPYKFDGSEVVTKESLPAWAIDSYFYAEKLPQSLQESSRS